MLSSCGVFRVFSVFGVFGVFSVFSVFIVFSVFGKFSVFIVFSVFTAVVWIPEGPEGEAGGRWADKGQISAKKVGPNYDSLNQEQQIINELIIWENNVERIFVDH